MKFVHVLVEGQTEETFVKEILTPHFWNYEININPVIVKTKKTQRGPHYRGGVVNYDHVKRDLLDLLYDSNAYKVTTMLDLYALPRNFPSFNSITATGLDKALALEQALFDDIDNDRLLPYLQVHEFEALLFSDPDKFTYGFSEAATAELVKIAQRFESPEEINETATGAPSKRILSVVGDQGYQKALDGPIIALEIELETMRNKCPHFNEWITKLENI